MVVSVSLKLGPNAPLCPHSPHTHPSYRNELRASRRACRRRLCWYIGRAWRLPANMGSSCMTVLQFLCTWVQKWCENLNRKGEQIMPNLGPEQGAENWRGNGPITTRPPGLSIHLFGVSIPCPTGLFTPCRLAFPGPARMASLHPARLASSLRAAGSRGAENEALF